MASADSRRRATVILLTFTLFVVQITFTASDPDWGDYVEFNQNDLYSNKDNEKVSVTLLYESLCPACIHFYDNQLLPTMQQLGDYIDLQTLPYGHAKRCVDSNGYLNISCQHGDAECYGNKLHACAIDVLQNVTSYVEFNACMMPLRSNDAAADQCGQTLQVDSSAIKMCAKSDRGSQLLNYYGDLSGNFNYKVVPTVFVNNENIRGKTLKQAVCDALKSPPEACQETT